MVVLLPLRIDRDTPVPLYHQLAEQLVAAVTDGTLAPGDPLENEVAMAQRLALSRPTVRRAIQELVDQGMLLRRRGLGTTVASRQIHRRAELTSLYDDLERAGEAPPSTQVLTLELETDEVVATALGLPPGDPMLHIVRLRRVGERPLAVMTNWLPLSLEPIDHADLERTGLYALLRDRGVRPVVAHQRLGARQPTPLERRRLAIRASQPVLTMTRAAFDAVGNPVEYGDHSYRADDYTIEVTIDER